MYKEIIKTAIADILLLTPTRHTDVRGSLSETYVSQEFDVIIGRPVNFIQDNHVTSVRGVLRGLHYQLHAPQAKLIRVVSGEIFDVAVDLRRNSPTFLQSVGCRLSAENGLMMFVPEGFAHGYLTLSNTSDVIYKVSQPRDPRHERAIAWNDKTLNIDWPATAPPLLSERDAQALPLDISQCY